MLPQGAASWTGLLVALALCNVLVIGLIAMAQKDLRYMLGYSSVMHMGYAFLGIATLGTLGVSAAVMLMFAHGLAIAALFLMADCVAQRGGGSTDMADFGGMVKQTPVLAGLFAAAMFASVGLPGFANFWGELGIFTSAFGMSHALGALTVLGIIISAIYGLRAVAFIFFGTPSERYEKHLKSGDAPKDMSFAEKAPVLILLGALLFVGFWPRSIGDMINKEVSLKYPAQVVQTCPGADASATPVALTVERKF